MGASSLWQIGMGEGERVCRMGFGLRERLVRPLWQRAIVAKDPFAPNKM